MSYRRSATLIEEKSKPRAFSKVYKVRDIDGNIVKLFEQNRILQRFKSVLLIGRQHMNSWTRLKSLIGKNKHKLDTMMLLNNTRDDNYILYAAIQDAETKILSSDYFRDHREKFRQWFVASLKGNQDDSLMPNMHRIFNRWLSSRQILIVHDKLAFPDEFDVTIHLHSNKSKSLPTLHIPVHVGPSPTDGTNSANIQWICASK